MYSTSLARDQLQLKNEENDHLLKNQGKLAHTCILTKAITLQLITLQTQPRTSITITWGKMTTVFSKPKVEEGAAITREQELANQTTESILTTLNILLAIASIRASVLEECEFSRTRVMCRILMKTPIKTFLLTVTPLSL